MKILKRNQIIISVIALMLITVGYMNFTSEFTAGSLETGAFVDSETMAGIGDAKLVNSDNVVENNISNDGADGSENTSQASSTNTSENTNQNSNTIPNNTTSEIVENDSLDTVQTSISTEYFTTSKLERDKMYSQMLETYESVLTNSSIPAEQKKLSAEEINNINNTKNSIMIAENLIKNLGYSDVVIFVNDNSVSVIVKAEKLEEADVAQIQNIVCREIGVEVEKVHISLK